MTHRYVPARRLFRGSKVNRDLRDQAFCRAVIAEAKRRHDEVQPDLPDLPEPDRCPTCGDPLSLNCEVRDDHYPYCSARCAIESEVDNAND